jgi:hypothetical protein
MATWQFYRHMPVYLRSGARLGRTEEIAHAVDYLHVQQGHVLIRDWYIPVTAIDQVTGRGVQLAVDMHDLRRHHWNVPPAEYLAQQGATPGYEYTSSADLPQYAEDAPPHAERQP